MKQGTKELIDFIGCIVIFVLAWILSSGCTRTIYTPVETVHTEYRDADTTRFTSLINELRERLSQKESRRESLTHKEKETVTLNEKGDTTKRDRLVFISLESQERSEYERTIESQRDSINALIERLASQKTDSVPVPYPVERKLSRWEQTKQVIGGMAIRALVAAALTAVLVWIVKRKRRK